MVRNFSQMTKGEVEKLVKDLAQQFLDNPTIVMKHLKDGYMPDGIEKLQFPIPPDFIKVMPDAPEHNISHKVKWSRFMAGQVIFHQLIGGRMGVEISPWFDVVAWHMVNSRQETKLGVNKMKEVDEELMASVDLDGIVRADVEKTLKQKKQSVEGMAFLNDSTTAVLTGHQLSSLEYGDAIKLKVTARNGAVSVADMVAVPLNWFDNQGVNDSEVNDFGVANLKTPLHTGSFFNCMTTPDTATSPDGKLRGAIFGHPDVFPELLYASADFEFDSAGRVKMICHNGDSGEGNSGTPLVIGQDAFGIHTGWDWLDEERGEKINVATPINHFGNDIKVFRQILDYMTLEPTLSWTLNKEDRDMKFLAMKDRGIAEVKAVGVFQWEVRTVQFKWREVLKWL